MTITREQVADLRAGDVVELVLRDEPGVRVVASGPLDARSGATQALFLGDYAIRSTKGYTVYGDRRSLTVISRAKPPLYVNHPRTEPVPGDIARDADGDAWQFTDDEWWCASPDAVCDNDPDGRPIEDFAPLRLLVDGETGQVVP